MTEAADPLLRRTWPQRLLILLGLVLAVVSGFLAWRISSLHQALAEVPRVQVPVDILKEPAEEGGPINLLLVGTDSGLGLAEDDANGINRGLENASPPRADVVMVLRLDPTTGDAAVLSIPRDLWVEVPGFRSMKLGEVLETGSLANGVGHLVETIQTEFDIEINNFALVDFAGFSELVDSVDGVPVFFPYSATDVGANFIVRVPDGGACVVLDGEQALGYVRGRKYQEFIDGEWVKTQGSDIERGKRQQDFLILALSRAIDKGARSLVFQNTLINAASGVVTLDDRMSPADLRDLGAAFSDFEPEELQRLNFGEYLYDDTVGGADVLRLNEIPDEILDVFRGFSDLRPSDVTVEIVETRSEIDEETSVEDHLDAKEFDVAGEVEGIVSLPTAVAFHPDQRAAADLLARFLVEVPDFEADPGLDPSGPIVLTVGDDYDGFLLFPRQSDTDFADALDDAAPSTTVADGGAPAPTVGVETGTVVTTTTAAIQGKPPEGVECR